MSKRTSGIEPRPRDFWPTPQDPIDKLVPHLRCVRSFDEPMCGDGAIVRGLQSHGIECTHLSDIEPTGEVKWPIAAKMCVYDIDKCDADCFITNPPWPHRYQKGEPTLGFIRHLSAIAPTWMLLSADFMHNVYAAEVMDYCVKIVAVGRPSWMHNGSGGMENAAWYLFDQMHRGRPQFFARAA